MSKGPWTEAAERLERLKAAGATRDELEEAASAELVELAKAEGWFEDGEAEA